MLQPIESLTQREIEILSLIARHCTNAEIAALLFISPATVATHIHRLLGKLRVHDRRQAARLYEKYTAGV